MVKDKIAALEQMKRSLPPLPEKGSKEKLNPDQQQTWKNISRIENKLIKMDQRLTLELSSATDLLGKIESMHTGVTGYLPGLWQTIIFQSRAASSTLWPGKGSPSGGKRRSRT